MQKTTPFWLLWTAALCGWFLLSAGLCAVAADRESGYAGAKKAVERLRTDARRSQWRAPWLELADDFLKMHEQGGQWPNRPAALFRSAECLEELARRSYVKKDYRAAADRYLRVAALHPQSVLADDALVRAATIQAEQLGEKARALELMRDVTRRYPQADHAAEARRFLARNGAEPDSPDRAGNGSSVRSSRSSTAESGSRSAPTSSPAASARNPRSSSPSGTVTAGNAAPSTKDTGARGSVRIGEQLGLEVHTVFIDPGHGGRDPGTWHNGIVERELVLDVSLRLGRILQANDLRVLFSRTRNTGLSLQQRPALANKSKADLFISIHVNAGTSEKISGLETYYLDFARDKEAIQLAARENAGSGEGMGKLTGIVAEVVSHARSEESRALAEALHASVLRRAAGRGFPLNDNGVRTAPFLVLVNADMPAVLVELGYSSNPREAAMLKQAVYRQVLAEGIALGIMNYRKALGE